MRVKSGHIIARAIAVAVLVLAVSAPLVTLDEALADGPGSGDAALAVESLVRATVAGDTVLEVRASISPALATVGDRLVLTLTVVRGFDGALAFPRVTGEIEPFEVLDVIIHETDERGGDVRERRQYVLTAFETGDLSVPSLAFHYVSPEGDTAVVHTDALVVTIESVVPPEERDLGPTPRDIKPPLELKRRIWPAIVIAVLVALVLAGLLYLRRWLRSRRREGPESEVAREVRREAAHVAALSRLGELDRSGLVEQGELPRFYLILTDVLRRYILDRFSVDAVDMTTKELGSAMHGADLDLGDEAWTLDLLSYADLSKFARHMPTGERAHDDLVAVRAFVERTRFRGLSESKGEE